MADRLTVADINLKNYAHNISKIIEIVGSDVKVMAVVKANAYGHGIEEIARRAINVGASHIGVASLGELKRLRNAGIRTPILILNYIDPSSVKEAIQLDASLTVMDNDVIARLEEEAYIQSKQVSMHLKVDTGMHRAGCDPDKVSGLARSITMAPHLELEGLFTHFAESEALDSSFTHQQLKVFTYCIDSLKAEGIYPPLIHCADSAATITFPEARFTLVRPGLVAYGLNPFPRDHEKHAFVEEHFKPVLSLKSQIAFIRSIEPGESVGYSRRWKAERQSRIALIPVGYGDGYRRAPQNAGFVLVHDQHVPIIGNVAMDQLVVDVTDIEDEVLVGDEVVLLGQQGSVSISAGDIAASYGTIVDEVVSALSDRIVRAYIN